MASTYRPLLRRVKLWRVVGHMHAETFRYGNAAELYQRYNDSNAVNLGIIAATPARRREFELTGKIEDVQ